MISAVVDTSVLVRGAISSKPGSASKGVIDALPESCEATLLLLDIVSSECGSDTREHPFGDQLRANGDHIRMIDAEQLDCRPADAGAADEQRACPSEVLRPFILAGIEEADHPPRARIEARNIRSFIQIAPKAGQREICESSAATVLLGQDVIDREPGTVQRLRHAAVFADVLGAPAYSFLQTLSHSRVCVTSGGPSTA